MFEQDSAIGTPICNDRLLTIKDVGEITGLCSVTTSNLIKKSGRGIYMHRRVYILESSLMAFLREKEQEKSC